MHVDQCERGVAFRQCVDRLAQLEGFPFVRLSPLVGNPVDEAIDLKLDVVVQLVLLEAVYGCGCHARCDRATMRACRIR